MLTFMMCSFHFPRFFWLEKWQEHWHWWRLLWFRLKYMNWTKINTTRNPEAKILIRSFFFFCSLFTLQVCMVCLPTQYTIDISAKLVFWCRTFWYINQNLLCIYHHLLYSVSLMSDVLTLTIDHHPQGADVTTQSID